MNEEKPKPETENSEKQEVYPNPETIKQKWDKQPEANPALDKEQDYKQASRDFNDLLVLASGAFSALTFTAASYWIKSIWLVCAFSSLFAITGIVLAVRNYKTNRVLTPLTIVGLAAATFTLLFVANVIIANLVIRSRVDGLY